MQQHRSITYISATVLMGVLSSFASPAQAAPSEEEKQGCTNDDYDRLRDFPVRGPNGSDRYDIGYGPYYERPSPSQDGNERACEYLRLSDDIGQAWMLIKVGTYKKSGGDRIWYYSDSGTFSTRTDGMAITPQEGRCAIFKLVIKYDGVTYKRMVKGITCN